ncbi:DNA polymerase III subunit theta [Klebsiella pneumoniae]
MRTIIRSGFNIASKSQEECDKVNVNLAASGVVYKERMNMPVVAEVVMPEQSENLRDNFIERLKSYREKSITLPKGSDQVHLKQEDVK